MSGNGLAICVKVSESVDMGGNGSGDRYGRGRRRTVEETPYIDSDLVMLKCPGGVEPDRMKLGIRVNCLEVVLVASITPLGYRRWWFMCPECGQRRKRLYTRNYSRYACRVCLGLTYRRSQENRRICGLVYRMIGYENAYWFERDSARMWKLDRASKRRIWWRREKRRIKGSRV